MSCTENIFTMRQIFFLRIMLKILCNLTLFFFQGFITHHFFSSWETLQASHIQQHTICGCRFCTLFPQLLLTLFPLHQIFSLLFSVSLSFQFREDFFCEVFLKNISTLKLSNLSCWLSLPSIYPSSIEVIRVCFTLCLFT